MKALVTGGGGFLGGAIVRQLLERGDEVWSFSRGEHAWLVEAGVHTLRGDLADAAAVQRALADAAGAGCETVFHVAARAGSGGPAAAYRAVNVDGTAALLEACRSHSVGRLVYTSSASVVLAGHDVEGADESLPYPGRWLAAYPASKAEAERLVLVANGEALSTVSLRPHLIWGPGDGSLLPRLVDRARRGRLRRIGPGQQRIDTVYVDDAARAQLLADERLAAEREAGGGAGGGAGAAAGVVPGERRESPVSDGSAGGGRRRPVAGRTFFITAGAPIGTFEMIDRLLAAAGEGPLTRTISARGARLAGALCEGLWRVLHLSGEPPLTRWVAEELSSSHWFDITAARRDLGYEPQVSLKQGLQRLAAWCAAGGLERVMAGGDA